MTTDEEFLKLALELGTMSPGHEGEKFIVFSGAIIFPNRITFLTLCREIERRTLERAAEKCDEYGEEKWQAYKLSPANHPDRANPHVEGQSDGAEDCAIAIRAMIKEKE